MNKQNSKKVEKEATRDGFGRGLVQAGKDNENVVALCADLTESTRIQWFAEEFPERFIEIGIGEQNLATVGSGMAAMGKIPFVASYAAFSPGRNWEQIKTTIALNNQPVKIVGAHAGLYTGPDGATHQMFEDLALMRVMPNMVVVAPGDSYEAEKATIALAKDPRPAYIQIVREKTPLFSSQSGSFSLDRAQVLSPGSELTIVSTGAMTYQAIEASEELYKHGIEAEVIHVPVIKPLDGATIEKSARKTKAVMTVEGGQVIGGLGGAVAEYLSEHYPVPIKRVGINDRYGESGDPESLLKAYELSTKHLINTAQAFVKKLGRP